VTGVTASFGEFKPDQTIEGAGIAPGTTIEALGPEGKSLTLSQAATETGEDVALESFSECTEEGLGCTIPVSPAGSSANFRAARPDGSAALFTQGGLALPLEGEIREGVDIDDPVWRNSLA
jgi:hypothetical protein